MSFMIRRATLADTDSLIDVIDQASDGVIPQLWAQFAPPGVAAADVGRAMVSDEDGPFTHQRAHMIETPAGVAGGMIGYRVTEADAAETPDTPPAFVPISALMQLTLGEWYINIIAVLPESRGQGLGGALLRHAEALAGEAGCPAISLIVAASNAAAHALYLHLGYEEVARVPFDTSEFGSERTEAILMRKPLAPAG